MPDPSASILDLQNLPTTLSNIGLQQAQTQGAYATAQGQNLANQKAAQINPIDVQNAQLQNAVAKMTVAAQAASTIKDQASLDAAKDTLDEAGVNWQGHLPDQWDPVTGPQYAQQAFTTAQQLKGQYLEMLKVGNDIKGTNNTANIAAANSMKAPIYTDGNGTVLPPGSPNPAASIAQIGAPPSGGSVPPPITPAVQAAQGNGVTPVQSMPLANPDGYPAGSALPPDVSAPRPGAANLGISQANGATQFAQSNPSAIAGMPPAQAMSPQAAPQAQPQQPLPPSVQNVAAQKAAINANANMTPEGKTAALAQIDSTPEGQMAKVYTDNAGKSIADAQDAVQKLSPAAQNTFAVISRMKQLNYAVPSGSLGISDLQNLKSNMSNDPVMAKRAADTAQFNQDASENLVNAVSNFTETAHGSRLDLPVASQVIQSKGIPQSMRPEARDALLNQQAAQTYNQLTAAQNIMAQKTGAPEKPLIPLSTPAFNGPSDQGFAQLPKGAQFLNLSNGLVGWKQ